MVNARGWQRASPGLSWLAYTNISQTISIMGHSRNSPGAVFLELEYQRITSVGQLGPQRKNSDRLLDMAPSHEYEVYTSRKL